MSVLSFLRRQFRPARQMPPGVVEKSGPAPQPRREISLAEISDGGERMTHLYPNDCYFAHLSIYDFALPWTTGKVVLDAGSGGGYGAAFLARHGAARVTAVEFDPMAVEFSQQHFELDNLQYRQGSIEDLSFLGDQSVDCVFSSNVIEHIPRPTAFMHEAARVLKQDGVAVIAVPPIVSQAILADDLRNPHHINHWTPRQWYDLLARYFASVEVYRHGYERDDIALDFGNTPEQTKVTEKDFVFEAVPIEVLYQKHTFTAVFKATGPRSAADLPPRDQAIVLIDDPLS